VGRMNRAELAVQEMLGHSTSTLTRDTYTSVSPRLAREAAERTAALVPRTVRDGTASGTDGLPSVSQGHKNDDGRHFRSEERPVH
jgi:hypothetical protein